MRDAETLLKGKPFAVGGRPEGRGVVASASYSPRSLVTLVSHARWP
jgi:nucleotidyltransferase/DNA polymerase involved in DNA repair